MTLSEICSWKCHAMWLLPACLVQLLPAWPAVTKPAALLAVLTIETAGICVPSDISCLVVLMLFSLFSLPVVHV